MTIRNWPGVAVLLLLPGCDTGGTGPAVPVAIQAYTAPAQNAVVGKPVAVPPAVRVTDRHGNGIVGVEVTFAVTHGGGRVPPAAVTSPGGIATAPEWVMGTLAQENVVAASIPGLDPVLFRALAAPGPPAVLEKVGGDGQRVTLGAQLLDSLSVRVLDAFGNGVGGVPVRLAASAGELSAPSVTTGPQGVARVALTLPVRSGTYSVFASVGDVAPQVFHVTVDPAHWMMKITDSVYARPGKRMPHPPALRVLNEQGWPIRGTWIGFALTASPHAPFVGPLYAVTDVNGEARLDYMLTAAGPHRFTASSPGMNPISFTVLGLSECQAWPYELFSPMQGVVYADACWSIGAYAAETYTARVAQPQCVEIDAVSTSRPLLRVVDASDSILVADAGGAGENARVRVSLQPGTYRIMVGLPPCPCWWGQEFRLTSRAVPAGEPCST